MLQAQEKNLIAQIAKDTRKLTRVISMPEQEKKVYLTPEQAEEFTGYKKDTLRHFVYDGKIQKSVTTFSGRKRRYLKSELEELFNLR